MIQNYQDAMAICKWVGYPNLFITFTCNPNWSEVLRFVQEKGLKPINHPDILCRVFKIKLDQFIKDLRQKNFFGRAKARMSNLFLLSQVINYSWKRLTLFFNLLYYELQRIILLNHLL